jgi:SAM-dependent methyltransferase
LIALLAGGARLRLRDLQQRVATVLADRYPAGIATVEGPSSIVLDHAITVILPAVGIGSGVSTVVRDLAVAAYALKTRGFRLDVVVTGDAGSIDLASKAAAEYGLVVESLPAESMGAAYLIGFRAVAQRDSGHLVATLDATGQHDASQLPRLVDQMQERKLDVIIGSRWARESSTPGLTWRRWALGRLANYAFRLTTGIRGTSDVTTSFRVIKVEILRQLDLETFPADARAVQMALVTQAAAQGRRIGEAAIIYHGPSGPVPSVTGGDMLAFAASLLPLRRRAKSLRKFRLSPAGRSFGYSDFGAAPDLERLGTADRFFGWTLDEFRPYLSGRVLEVGAGLGTITRKLAESDPDLKIVALEPADNLFSELAAYAAVTPQVEASQLISGEYLAQHSQPFDTIIYLNVLEHIKHDTDELKITAAALRPGGHILVFGPGLDWLYSELDYNAGHYRRYRVGGLRKVAEEAGLEVVAINYFDVLGVLPYFIVYRLLRSQAISGSTMWGYDRVLVPLSRLIQRALRRPPLGKNVIMVARKPL